MRIGKDFNIALIKLLFHGEPIPGIAENDNEYPLADFWLSLHSADPGLTGDQTANEAAYDGYSRIPLSRDIAGVAIDEDLQHVVFQEDMTFPEVQAGNHVYTHAMIGTDEAGEGMQITSGELVPPITVGVGQQPEIKAGSIFRFRPPAGD